MRSAQQQPLSDSDIFFFFFFRFDLFSPSPADDISVYIMSLLRRRKAPENETSDPKPQIEEKDKKDKKKEKTKVERKVEKASRWSCIDNCCWFVGCVCTLWWTLIFLYNVTPASFPQYVTEAITGPLPDPPGVKLQKEGLRAKHPVVFVPGIVTGGLELWEGHQCAEGLFRKRLWGGTFGEVYKR